MTRINLDVRHRGQHLAKRAATFQAIRDGRIQVFAKRTETCRTTPEHPTDLTDEVEDKAKRRPGPRRRWPLALALAVAAPAQAQGTQEAALAKKLANPIASLISVPLQYNYDTYGGAERRRARQPPNIQPVIPFSLNDQWNLITRNIIPLVDQGAFPTDAMNTSGLGDITSSLFFSPKEPTASGMIWGGAGVPLPTATKDVLGAEKWGHRADGRGAEADRAVDGGHAGQPHLGLRRRQHARQCQRHLPCSPSCHYTTQTQTTFSANTESTYDWRNSQWTVPLNVGVAQMFKIGSQIMQAQVAAARYWADAPGDGPEG